MAPEALLHGSKKPLWSCSCGANGNWHNRTTCRSCGREPPAAIRSAQRANHKKWETAQRDKKQPPRSGPAGGPGSKRARPNAWEKGPPANLSPADIMRQQLATAKREKFPQAAIDMLEKDLAEEVEKVQAARPLARQAQRLDFTISKLERQLVKDEAAADDARARRDEAQAKLDEALAEVGRRTAELEAARQARADSSLQLYVEGTAPKSKEEAFAQISRLEQLLLETKKAAEELPETAAMAVDDGQGAGATGTSGAPPGGAVGAAKGPPAESHGTKRDVQEPAAPELIDAFKRARTMDQAAFDQIVGQCANSDWSAVLSSMGPGGAPAGGRGDPTPPAV